MKETKILVIRPDRLGDVILSTPVLEVLKRHFPHSRLTLMVQAAHQPLLSGLTSVDEIMTFDPNGRHAGLKGWVNLMADLRERKFDIAVVLQSHWKIAAAVFGSGIPNRVGPLSKPHSFFFYNRGTRQRRSHVEMHETDYNLQLLRRLGIRVGTRNVPVRVHVRPEAVQGAREWLQEAGRDWTKSLVAVHPGMGGSALNWPEDHYLGLIRQLLKEGRQVLITGGPTETSLLERFKTVFGESSGVMFYGGNAARAVDFLGGLLSHADLVVAPSTGPLHLAVALGRPVMTFYPPIRVQSAIRWGPYVSDDSRAAILVPENYCGEDFRCRGNACNYYPCMKSLLVPQAMEEVRKLLDVGQKK